jgi:acetyltransferase-like isoleucine patch superfamily enzyme
LRCKEGELSILKQTSIAKGAEINVGKGGTILIKNNISLGKGSFLSVGGNNKIVIGERTSFFSDVFLSGSISIGKGCLFAKGITILSGTHIIEDRRPIRVQDAEYIEINGAPPDDPVEIGDDCWIGINAVILPGVKLGKGCIVAAGAVVTMSFPDFSKVGGVPAKLLGKRGY